ENPSCRWTAWDAVNNQRKPRTDLNLITQDRAWSSPIWYVPSSTTTADWIGNYDPAEDSTQ
ncbi:MAG TPA: DUF3604 domain-containing protein, partial [Gammaproteobacteria bacterium]|nr:DUF3604 domain-containing protein [Gammaproteobacteria bacterium]